MKTLSIIIPAYNEEKTILKTLEVVESVDLGDIQKEIIVIDDFSADGTRELLKTVEDKYKVLYQERNKGKGAAVRRAYLESTGDYIIIQDADMELDPHEYPILLEPILQDKADVVYGSRFLDTKARKVIKFVPWLANKFLTLFSNMMTGLTLTDMETCYKLLSRSALDKIKHKLTANRFNIEPEITAMVAKHKFRIFEVSITYENRGYEEGKHIDWKDGLSAIWYIIRYNMFRRK